VAAVSMAQWRLQRDGYSGGADIPNFQTEPIVTAA
jgi:hypothetical protein